jgi:hypothetical protein
VGALILLQETGQAEATIQFGQVRAAAVGLLAVVVTMPC